MQQLKESVGMAYIGTLGYCQILALAPHQEMLLKWYMYIFLSYKWTSEVPHIKTGA